MIRELAEFGKKVREGHDALKKEPISIDLVINEDGCFQKFSVIEKVFKPAEAITAKKGKARLLLDKAEEVLCFVSPRELKNAKGDENKAQESVRKKHELFLKKLEQYKNLDVLKPVVKFYSENRINGLDVALEGFSIDVDEKEFEGNIAFRIADKRLHELQEVYDAIILCYEKEQAELLKGERKICSVCGQSDYPVIDKPHGYIKSVPDGQEGKNVLVSYNEKAFESYSLSGNYNSSICTNCAKNYVEGLNYLLTHGYVKNESKHTNRKSLGKDTAMVFWTKENADVDELDIIDTPDAGRVAELIDSVYKGKNRTSKNIDTNRFYSLTLSGAAARIAIRDWVEISLDEYRSNIANWFTLIKINKYDYDQKKAIEYYPALWIMAKQCDKKESKDRTIESRVAKHLWNTALNRIPVPLWVLTSVLKRIAHNETTNEGKNINTLTPERASLIKLILNTNNNNKGGNMLKEELDTTNTSRAYLCGRLFASIEGIQKAALGKDINAGVRERFFSSASSSPAAAFGRLLRQMQNHLTKVKQDKPQLAIYLDKEVQELCQSIKEFPAILSLEEQGQFALGYYHQKHYYFNKTKENKEFESLTDNN